MRINIYSWGFMVVLLFSSCQSNNSSNSTPKSNSPIYLLEKEVPTHYLRSSIQVLKEKDAVYTIQDVADSSFQHKFQPYPEFPKPLENYQYYWGKLQIENRLPNASEYAEWVIVFSSTWTSLDVFMEQEDGTWALEKNGTFIPEPEKKFAPTARGNLVKVLLPPNEAVVIYFKGKSERTAIKPSFYTYLEHIETFYENLLETKIANALFIGFLLMMFLYNLIVYFLRRDLSFIFYSGYLLMVVGYAAYPSEDLVDWFGLFPYHPEYQGLLKLSLYLAMMCYLAFIRSFLDLERLLPRWDTIFKVVIYLGFPLILLDIVVLFLTNFSYVVEDRITVPYIILSVFICCAILYPLYKTKDKKGYFIIAGIVAISIGAILTVASRLWVSPFSIFYLKAGTIIEILIFSLGLAFRQRQQKQAQQQAAFELKESQLIQEKNQVEADRLKELNEFKARFYTNITHEFRTPLTVIMGMNKNIKNHKEETTLIHRNSENLLRLINQLLALSKLESGTIALSKIHQDIIFYLQYLTESFYSSATQKNIRLLFHSEEKEVMMDYDEDKIQQIVYNLLSNALKFTKEYGKIIFHASKVEEQGNPFLKLKVKDSGIGIPSGDIPHIFDRFYQVDMGKNRGGEGTGIGLALTKELVELMNGRIEVQSEIGDGTEFSLYLPIETEAKLKEDKTHIPTVLYHGGEKGQESDTISTQSNETFADTLDNAERAALPELLIIEDNDDIITYIKTILKNSYNIHTATNGAKGIENAFELIPDIIISDVMMPEKNGYEVCESLKQDEKTSHIPIVLLTAKATQSDKIDGLKYGADAYLTKPFDKEELMVRLEKLVALRQQLQVRYSSGTTDLQDKEPTLDDIFLQKLQDHIQENLMDTEFGVGELTSAIEMSQMQMYRKLKALTGKTPSQFIRSYRLQKALELLQKGDLIVSEVAYEVGFSDPSYFSRVFQKEFGKSPSYFVK